MSNFKPIHEIAGLRIYAGIHGVTEKREGIHLLQPTHLELEAAIEKAFRTGHRNIFVYSYRKPNKGESGSPAACTI